MPFSSLRVLSIAHNAVAASNRARVEALRRLPGLELDLLTPRWWYEEGRRIDVSVDETWRVGRTVFTGNGTRYAYLTGLLGSLRRAPPDVIDLFEEPFSVVALQTLVARALLAPAAALVFYSAVNVHRTWRWPYRAIEHLVLRHADGAHTPNQDAANILRAKGFARERPVRVIPIGVDAERFASASPAALRDVPRPRIGFVGRFEPVKGLDVLLDAFSRLNRRGSLVLAGDGSQRSRLRGPGVHVFAPIAFEVLPSFVKALDVVVLPSVTIPPLHREQFGRVLIEAMAAGVPVIGSTSGGIAEVIGDAGSIVPERDAAALAGAIAKLLDDDQLRGRLIQRGRQRVAERFAWPRVAEQARDLFLAALASRQGVTADIQVVRA